MSAEGHVDVPPSLFANWMVEIEGMGGVISFSAVSAGDENLRVRVRWMI